MITSFRARALARDWDHHVWLLERTINSMLRQTNSDVFAVVACHDIPKSSLTRNNKVHFLTVKFPTPKKENDDMCVDKVLKLSLGSEWAVAQGCEYVMFNDADDLVSNRIAAFVAAHAGAPGWHSTSELFYTYGGRLLRDHKLPDMCSGPCVILRSDLVEFASPPFEGEWCEIIKRGGEGHYLQLLARHHEKTCVLAAVGLQNFREYMARRGQALLPMPFAANIVINHSDSTSHVPGGIGSYDFAGRAQRPALRPALAKLRQGIRWLPTLRLLTPELRREFSVPPSAEIPPARRNGGSVFWR
jgi:hypothetical protein